MMRPSESVGDVLYGLVRHPIRNLVRRWNWKSAMFSAVARAAMFFAANLPAGLDAGLRAMVTELVFRAFASGVFGSATQAFRAATPPVAATLTALLVVPAAGHLAEFVVHRLAGTARLGESVAISVAFSVVSTAFNLFAMRRGALIVGDQERTLAEDMRRMPALALAFGATGLGLLGVTFARRTAAAIDAGTIGDGACRYRRST
jgi:hypothetical protein